MSRIQRSIVFVLLVLLLTACGTPAPAPTVTATATPTASATPTAIPTATATPVPTPPPALTDLAARLDSFVNAQWGRNPIDGEIYLVSGNEAVRYFELALWGAVTQWVELAQFLGVAPEEIDWYGGYFGVGADGTVYYGETEIGVVRDGVFHPAWEGGSDVTWGDFTSKVEVVDQGEYAVKADGLYYGGEKIAEVDLDGNLVFHAIDGTRWHVPPDQIQVTAVKVDDGLDESGNLKNERVVLQLKIMGEAQVGGFEWVEAIVQEGEFIPVPDPDMAVQIYRRVMVGEDYNTVMNDELGSLPKDWHDLGEVDIRALDEYVKKISMLWQAMGVNPSEPTQYGAFPYEIYKEYFEPGEPFASDTVFGFANKGAPMELLNVVRVKGKDGDYLLFSMPVIIHDNRLILLNVLLNPDAQDELIHALGLDGSDPKYHYAYEKFGKFWERLKSGDVDAGEIWLFSGIIDPKNTTLFKEFLAQVERLNGMVPRYVVDSKTGGVVRESNFSDNYYRLFFLWLEFGGHTRFENPNGELHDRDYDFERVARGASMIWSPAVLVINEK